MGWALLKGLVLAWGGVAEGPGVTSSKSVKDAVFYVVVLIMVTSAPALRVVGLLYGGPLKRTRNKL